MPITTIALIGASAALSAALFKDKDSRVKDVIDFAKSSPEDFQSSAHYNIIRNDINAYITGIKDPEFHHILLDAMAWGNKPIGYFGRLEGRLEISDTGQLKIKKMTWLQSVITDFHSNTGSTSQIFLAIFIAVLTLLSMEFGAAEEQWMQGASVIFSALAGFLLFNWFSTIAVTWKQHAHKHDLAEYNSVLKRYAEEKQRAKDSTVQQAVPAETNASGM
ncbi:hypothetical protein K5Y32_21985 [Pantoea sp. DY-15]|uniref:hypothetical protein n=1 Tax=Pantoea sp. DY-15 TaxID=2871489 RepID=UPI001C943F86|nr:hypothetical protein [Pantoea sp. DY-15]MBY4890613.1 hypothetical protein [Pantoea sp. DY-15]